MPGKVVCEHQETIEVVDKALLDLWSVVNELSRVRPPHSERYRVTVFGSARILEGDPLFAEVRDLARRLSAAGCDIVTGGGPGLMQAANEGEALGDPEGKTRSIGVRIELPFEQGANPWVENVYTHRTFFSRLHQFVRLTDAFVVVGGGIGTTLETLIVWQLLQVRHVHDVPLIFVGDMWRGLVDWARTYMLRGPTPLANAEDLDIPRCVATIDEAVAAVERHRAQRAARPASP